MSARWEISAWPGLAFHAFLSHCAEDRERLVMPVKNSLEDRRLLPWIDRDEYPLAQDPFRALRDQLILCRHVVYFITPAFLRQGRGWCSVERTYAEMIQRHFEYPTASLWTFELPLVFLPRSDESLRSIARSAWSPLLSRAVWFADRLDRRATRQNWAVSQITRIVRQQNREVRGLSDRLLLDSALGRQIDVSAGLLDRVTSLLPLTYDVGR
jgi:hypothetical protein